MTGVHCPCCGSWPCSADLVTFVPDGWCRYCGGVLTPAKPGDHLVCASCKTPAALGESS